LGVWPWLFWRGRCLDHSCVTGGRSNMRRFHLPESGSYWASRRLSPNHIFTQPIKIGRLAPGGQVHSWASRSRDPIPVPRGQGCVSIHSTEAHSPTANARPRLRGRHLMRCLRWRQHDTSPRPRTMQVLQKVKRADSTFEYPTFSFDETPALPSGFPARVRPLGTPI